jgi:hypothetical protein
MSYKSKTRAMKKWRALSFDTVNWIATLVDQLLKPKMALSKWEKEFVDVIWNKVGKYNYELKLTGKQLNVLEVLESKYLSVAQPTKLGYLPLASTPDTN